MKKLTIQEICSFNPCYSPTKYLPEDWSGSLVQLLKKADIPAKDRLWVVVRSTLMTQNQLKHYGLKCARLAEKYTKDDRVKACNDATELFLKGDLPVKILKDFRQDARNAAAASAAYAAAYAAASAAYAADAAAYADAAADAAAYAAAYAADADAARVTMREQQCLELIKILETVE